VKGKIHKVIGIHFFICAILINIITCNPKTEKDINSGKEMTLRLEPGTGNPRNSEGDFIQLKDGRILFVYTHFTGGSGDHASAYLAGRSSNDDGKTWTTKDILILPNEGNMNIMSVSLMRLRNGNIALFYLRKNSESDCIPMMRISSDEAKSWSKPKQVIDLVGYYVLNNDRVLQLSDGRLILPVALHKTPETDWSSMAQILCYISDDDGQTWSGSQVVPNPESILLQEPGVVELKNGKLMMFCRTDAGVQYLSFSENLGLTWSPIEASKIKSPLSPASIERIPTTGELLMVWNENLIPNNGKRTPLAIAISHDEGQSWKRVKYIENDPNGWYCYTAILFIKKHVLLGHCAGNRPKYGGLETTQITRLSLDWIYK
jgi:predicted neuraminidase